MISFKQYLISQQLSLNTLNQYLLYEKKLSFQAYNGLDQDVVDSFLADLKYVGNAKAFMKQYLAYIEENTPPEQYIQLKVRKRKGRIAKKETEYLTIQQVYSLVEKVYPLDIKFALIILLMFECGMRVSEIVNLKINNIIVEKNLIKIKGAKGGKFRDVIFSEDTCKIMKQYIEHHEDCTPEHFFSFANRGEELFGVAYQQSKRRMINKKLKEYGKRFMEREDIHSHMLRHSCGYYLANDLGMPLDEVAIYLGHSSVETTKIYAHKDKDKVLNKIKESYQ